MLDFGFDPLSIAHLTGPESSSSWRRLQVCRTAAVSQATRRDQRQPAAPAISTRRCRGRVCRHAPGLPPRRILSRTLSLQTGAFRKTLAIHPAPPPFFLPIPPPSSSWAFWHITSSDIPLPAQTSDLHFRATRSRLTSCMAAAASRRSCARVGADLGVCNHSFPQSLLPHFPAASIVDKRLWLVASWRCCHRTVTYRQPAVFKHNGGGGCGLPGADQRQVGRGALSSAMNSGHFW